MKEKKDMPEERSKKPSDAKKNLDDIMKRIEPFLPEENQVLHKRYSEWKSGASSLRVECGGDGQLHLHLS